MTNSLASRFPEVAAGWHGEKNGELRPDQVMAGSAVKVWWKCPAGPDHEWQTAIKQRTSGATGCPHCNRERTAISTTRITQSPDRAAE
ncbi:MAG: zinc-ribbon domain-containing protein [Dehalococcoidia bacterium]